MFDKFTDHARRTISLAQEEARMLNHSRIGTEHILLGLIHEDEGVAAKALEPLGISLEAVRQQVEELIGRGQQAPSGDIPFTPHAKKTLELSLREALRLGHSYVGTEHILLGLIQEGDGFTAQVLGEFGDLNRVRFQLLQLARDPNSNTADGTTASPASYPVLDEVGQNLTQAARDSRIDPVIGRDKEIERVVQVLSLRTKNNPVLIGEPGIGTIAVIEGLARKIADGEVPAAIRDKQLFTLNFPAMDDAEGPRSDYYERLAQILEEICVRGDIILCINDIHTLVEASAAADHEATGPVAKLKFMLAHDILQIIGVTTLDEYRKYLKNDALLERHFQPIEVTEPTVTHAIEILKSLRDRYEAHHRVSITDSALVASALLADRYISDRFLPDKAIDLIDEAGARMRTRLAATSPDLREYDEKIAQVRRDKESALNSQDFEKAAALRDTEKLLLSKKTARKREWKDDDTYVVPEINEDIIIEVVASVSGVPVHRIYEQQPNLKPRNAPQSDLPDSPRRRYILQNDAPSEDPANDLLDTTNIASTIASVLATSRTASPFVIAIDGGWGIGKSSLLRQIESQLDTEKDIVCVRFNAWTAQGGGALEGLIKSVLGELDSSILRRNIRRLAKKRGLISGARILTAIIARFLGVTRLVDELWESLAVDAKSRNEMRDLIGDMLSQWMKRSHHTSRALVVFIDDLDRCSDEIIIQVCEAVKLYLDAPGLMFVLACDLSVLARGAAGSARGGVSEGRAYLEKIIQVAYRVPPPDDAKMRNLIRGYGDRSGISPLLDEVVIGILAQHAGRNPRKIKRVINSFVLEYQLNPAWGTFPLDSSLLVIVVLMQHAYPSFYDYLTSENSVDDPIGAFLDYASVRARVSNPPSPDSAWWATARRAFQDHGMPPPDRSPGQGDKLMTAIERLEGLLPPDFPLLARDNDFITLLRSIGDKDTRKALRSQLVSRPLGSEAVAEESISPASSQVSSVDTALAPAEPPGNAV